MKVSMYAAEGEFPKLKGKAAEVRHLGPALLQVFRANCDNTQRSHRQCLMALQYSVRMEQLVDENASVYVWPAAVAEEFASAAHNLLALQTALAQHYHPQGVLLFSTTIKSHYLLHVAMLSRHLNPRLAWCYAGEDLMHRVRVLVSAAQRGTGPALVPSKVLRKYLWGLSYDLVSDLGWWR
jgi:hypothetical protein